MQEFINFLVQLKVWVIFTGPSLSGKTTASKYLLKNSRIFERAVTTTTRKARSNEIHGIDYFFTILDLFKEMISKGAFAEYKQIFPGQFSGIELRELHRVLSDYHIPVSCLDVDGALDVMKRESFEFKPLIIYVGSTKEEMIRRFSQDAKNNIRDESEREKRELRLDYELGMQIHFPIILPNNVISLEEFEQSAQILVMDELKKLHQATS